MAGIPTISKEVWEHISTVCDVAKGTWRLLRATKQLEFSIAKKNQFTGKLETTFRHTVDLTDEEHEHLDNGGKIILIHLCGWKPHISF